MSLEATAWFTRGFERDPSLEGMVGWRLELETIDGLHVEDR